jgi:hypothetical protein
VQFTNLDISAFIPQGDVTIELQGISALINNSDIKIYNTYIPPVSASTQYLLDIKGILDSDNDSLVLGNFNAHNLAWNLSLSDN